MHVVLYHDAIIPPPKYGGTERIVYWLATALNTLGHRTTLIAREGSHVPGTECRLLREGTERWETLIPNDADILHLWATPQTPPKLPFVVTIEGNGQAEERFHPNTIFVSRKHAQNHGSTHFVYNGIDVNEYTSESQRDEYLVFLAKASWSVKNLDGAIAVARKSGLRLEVLGSRDWPLGLHRCLPAIRGVRYHGMVSDQPKRKLLSRAKGLLFPVRWHEPFGIAITEALASGCPVFGTPYGSLPEIVTPQVGLLAAACEPLASALKNTYSPEKCRARVLDGFTHVDMARSYLDYYANVMRSGQLDPTSPNNSPQTLAGFHGLSSKNLLPWN
jgi:glycosyltransferase involved in cell wall biosynthesis